MSIVGSLPVSLANNTLADATQVMANFNYIVAQINANAAGLSQSNNFSVNPSIGGAQFLSAANISSSMTSLRTQVKTGPGIAWLLGYYQPGDGGGSSTWYYDSLDITTADNGVTVVVAADGGRWKLAQATVLSIKQAGAVLNGTTDDTLPLLAAIASFGGAAGTVRITGKMRLSSNVTVPANVTIKGSMTMAGSPGTNSSAPYGSVGSAILIDSAVTITLMGGAGIDGCLIYRGGMTFPAADSSAFAGTAITAGADDCFVVNSMILGFAQAYTSNGFQRHRIQNVFLDCNAGILINNCADIGRIQNVQGWPFATIATSGGPSTLQRSGSFIKCTTLNDWSKITDCFGYAYYRGYWLSSVNSMTLEGCGADSTGSYPGQIGFVVDGTSNETRLVNCQSAGQDSGLYVSTTAGLMTTVDNFTSWSCTTHGIQIAAGDVTVVGGVIRSVLNGVTVTSNASRVFADKIRFSSITGIPFNLTVPSTLLFIGDDNDYGDFNAAAVTSNNTPQIIASAAAIAIPPSGRNFAITGTTNTGTFVGGWCSRVVTLYFSTTVSMLSSTGSTSALRCSGGANFSAVSGSSLTIAHNGTQWYEIGRSA